MNWLLKTLVGAVVAGLGWRLGADAYESIKKRISSEKEKKAEEEKEKKDEKAENGAGAQQTGAAPSSPPQAS
jgi:hypothetical protein